MQQDIEISSEAPPGQALSWSEVWIRATTQPSVATYETLLQDPQASGKRGYGWVALSTLISFVVSALFGIVLGMLFASDSAGAVGMLGGGLSAIICGGPLIVVLAVLGIALTAGLSNAVARMLGGTGTYDELVYLMSAYSAPLSFVGGLLSAIPIIGTYLAYLPIIYSLVLNVIAVKTSHKFEWWKAFVSGIAIYFIIMAVVAVVVIAMLTLLGPAIQDTFNQTMMELQ